MKINDIPEDLRVEYKAKCDCGKVHTILSQRDSFPEYETEIYLLCECTEYVEFILPVN